MQGLGRTRIEPSTVAVRPKAALGFAKPVIAIDLGDRFAAVTGIALLFDAAVGSVYCMRIN